MILRRIREHVGKHNWFAVGVDLVIVVLGVFLGTQVSNWNAERLAQEAGSTYRARIASDLQNNVEDMQSRAAYFRQVRGFGLQVLQRLDSSAPLSDEQFVIAAYQATQIYPRPMNRSTFDEVLSVGALNSLGKVDLRQRISNYYVAVETSEVTFRTVTPYRDIVRSAIAYHVQERIRTACAETMATSPTNGLSILTLPADCELGLSATEIARAATRLRETPGLERDVTRLLADIDQKLIQAGRAEERARNLAAELAGSR